MSIILSMAAFALAASISPGRVNIVELGSGALWFRSQYAACYRSDSGVFSIAAADRP